LGSSSPSQLSVIVYNIYGQEIAVIANGIFNSGYHRLHLDTSEFSSGNYFIYAKIPDRFNEFKRIIFIK